MSGIDVLNETMELIIMPTEKCNFNCIYCYEDFKIGGISKETYHALKLFILKRIENLKVLHIGWFGGEPLLKYELILNFMDYLNKLKIKKNPTLVISSGATTNGYFLTPVKFINLVNNGVTSYQITFDGDKEDHDRLRLRADGNGTFDVIWSNIIHAHNTDKNFSITLRVHVNEDNKDNIKKFIDKVAAEIGNDKRFSIFIKPLEQLGGKNDAKLSIIKNREIINQLFLYANTNQLNCSLDDPNYICYAAKPNSLVIRADGSINKCTVALYSDHNNIGKLLRDGKVKINSDKFNKWIRGIKSGNMEELGCPAKNYPDKNETAVKTINLNVLR